MVVPRRRGVEGVLSLKMLFASSFFAFVSFMETIVLPLRLGGPRGDCEAPSGTEIIMRVEYFNDVLNAAHEHEQLKTILREQDRTLL